MIPTAPAIHYTVTVMCGESPCAIPVLAQLSGGGGSPTPVPLSATSIRLRIEPQPTVMPHVTWRSRDERVVKPSYSPPLQTTLWDPDDTAARPATNYLQTFLIPGGSAAQRIGDVQGVTTVDADIGAPVNEHVSIPVYAAGTDRAWRPTLTPQNSRIAVTPIGVSTASPPLRAAIRYASPVTPTYGSARTLFTEMPWTPGTGGFFQGFGSVEVQVSPQPIESPHVAWSIDGDSATITQQFNDAVLRGVHPGTATLHAHVDAPINKDLSIPLVTYAPLVLPCAHGVSFGRDGALQFTDNAAESDLFLDCRALQVPGGGVLVTNGDEPTRQPAKGTIRGPQFPELGASSWSNTFTVLDGERYTAAIRPCTVPESPGIARIDYSCTKMSAHTLLFRTRDGRLVKWLIQIGNGLNLVAGPYQVL